METSSKIIRSLLCVWTALIVQIQCRCTISSLYYLIVSHFELKLKSNICEYYKKENSCQKERNPRLRLSDNIYIKIIYLKGFIKKKTNLVLEKVICMICLHVFFSCFGLGQDSSFKSKLLRISHKRELTYSEYDALINAFESDQEYMNALVYSEKYILVCETNKDTNQWVKAINHKANNLTDLKLVEEGIAFCETSSRAFRPQDSRQYELLCFKWGALLFFNEQYDESLKIYNRITSPDLVRSTIYLNNLASTHIQLDNFDQASYYLKKALVQNNFQFIEDKGIILINLAECEHNRGQYDNSLKHLQDAYALLSKKKQLQHLIELFQIKFQVCQKMKNTYGAMNSLDSVSKYNDLNFENKVREELQEIVVAKHRERILRKKIASENKQVQLYQEKFLAWLLIGLTVLTLSILFFLLRSLKSKKKFVSLEQKLLRSQMTPHFVFNSLSIVQGMILNEDNSKAAKYLTHFSKLIRKTLENSKNRLITLEEELDLINNYVCLQQIKMESNVTFSVLKQENIYTEELMIPPMVLQPFVENCFEHGFKNEIERPFILVRIGHRDNRTLLIEIEDNGEGLVVSSQNQKIKKSLSTQITRERLLFLSKGSQKNCKIEIIDKKSSHTSGVLVRLTVPKILE